MFFFLHFFSLPPEEVHFILSEILISAFFVKYFKQPKTGSYQVGHQLAQSFGVCVVVLLLMEHNLTAAVCQTTS